MVKFERAVEWLKSGGKVRRQMWGCGNYLYLADGNQIRNNFNQRVDFCNIHSFLANDWEIFEEEKKSMVCMDCGLEDESYTAYCSRCCRSAHRMMTKKEQRKFKEFLGGLSN